MLKEIRLFLTNPEQSNITKILNSDYNELKILQKMLSVYLESGEEVKVREILREVFKVEGLEALEKTEHITTLLKEGWIVLDSFNRVNDNLTTLELFNSYVSLSVSFLKLLEGKSDLVIPEETPYKEHSEFLHDEFLRVELYERLYSLKSDFLKESASIKRVKNKLKLIEDIIEEKIKKTKIDLPVLNFIRKREFDEKEELIFWALLKEEYTSGNERLREQNYLLSLISENEIERIKNRSLLDDNSKLVGDGVLEYDELFNVTGRYTKVFFINEDILKELIYPKKKHKIEHIVKESIFDFYEPVKGFEEVVLPKATKESVVRLLKQADKKVLKLLREWGIKTSNDIEAKVIFYGPPGTGKTLTAYAIAKELDKPILSLDSSKILSMYVGESEKNVRRMFDEYYSICEKLKTKPILLLNEADQFLSTRTSASFSSADKMHNQMQNIFLEQLEKFDGFLIATTNLLETLDSAFSRRFDYKIKFEKPSFKERKRLWDIKLPKNAEYEKNFSTEILSRYELSGAQIEVVIKNTALKTALKKEPVFKVKDFTEEIEREQKNAFDSQNELGFKI
ncbi:MAG: ATP-binding protein [Nautiliaceae bacterium]